MWRYIERANRENFLYNLRCIDGESMQYTRYGEGQFYGWHNDAGLAGQYKPVSLVIVQKVLHKITSMKMLRWFVNYPLFFNFPIRDSYEGGNLQLLDEAGKSYFAPRKRGTVVLFDSRTMHRVTKVKSGLRKSIVGWTVGPRWK